MPLEQLILNCPHCDAWYTRKNAPSMELVESKRSCTGFETIYYCDCHGNKTELRDAHEWDIITPFNEQELERLQMELREARNLVDDLENQIRNIKGE